MKQTLIILFLICITHAVYPTSYAHLKSDFKKNMYQKQSSLMGNKAYMAFLEPYLIEGEKTLVIAREALKMADADALKPYFDLLIKINTTLFFHQAHPSNRTTQSLQKKKVLLLDIIKEIIAKWDLDVDPEIELANTIALFERASKDFYSKLGFIARAKVAAAATLMPMIKR